MTHAEGEKEEREEKVIAVSWVQIHTNWTVLMASEDGSNQALSHRFLWQLAAMMGWRQTARLLPPSRRPTYAKNKP